MLKKLKKSAQTPISVEKADKPFKNISMKKRPLTKSGIMEDISTLFQQLGDIVEQIEHNTSRTIICKKCHGKTMLYLKDGNGKATYINGSMAENIPTLARDRYHNEIVKVAKREMSQLSRSLNILSDGNHGVADIDEVYEKFPDILKPFISPHPLTSEEYARRWQESNVLVKRKSFHKKDDYHRFKTIRGDYVGSKSEVMIADRLLYKGIPYHYEVAFIPEVIVDKESPVYGEFGDIIGYETPGFDPFDMDTLHPDFYVLNKRTRKAYFWEHLGKLNDPDYCQTNLNRLIRMLDAGYTIGEDILITHENSMNPLKTESIDAIIEKYLE